MTSPRIQLLASKIQPKGLVYDLCCDHGLIGTSALEAGCQVIFNDREPQIIASLERKLESLRKYRGRAWFWTGDAAQLHFKPNSQIVLAGVGNHLIAKVLKNINRKTNCRIILGIQKRSIELRQQLAAGNWLMESEHLVKEQGRFREVLVLSQSGVRIPPVGQFNDSPKLLKIEFYSELSKHLSVVQSVPPETKNKVKQLLSNLAEA